MRSRQLLEDLPTPCAIVDEARMRRNIGAMAARATALSVRLRPHAKTAKCVQVARAQLEAGGQGITVSTLREADQFFAAGIDDILYAVGIALHKLTQVRALRQRGCRLTVIVDSVEAARAVAGAQVAAMIEIDTDGHRAGVRPESDLLLAVGHALHEGGGTLRGVMTHAGSSYAEHTREGLVRVAEQERSGCVRAAERLRGAGLPCPEVSVGSTPTALSAEHLDGVTELRAGVYVFHDLVMCNIGVARPDDVALSVLATVIGHQREKGWALIDAGWMATSRDRGTQAQAVDYGYGAVCDLDGRVLDGWIVADANQEHGIVACRSGVAVADVSRRFPLGARLRILPNHACATAAQFDHYQVLGVDGAVHRWDRFSGW